MKFLSCQTCLWGVFVCVCVQWLITWHEENPPKYAGVLVADIICCDFKR